jgi:hypothetical protein
VELILYLWDKIVEFFTGLFKKRRRYLIEYQLIKRRKRFDYMNGETLGEIKVDKSKKVWATSFKEARQKVRNKKGYNVTNINVTRYRR